MTLTSDIPTGGSTHTQHHRDIAALLDPATATAGQVLTADGAGSASYEDATGGGGSGTQLRDLGTIPGTDLLAGPVELYEATGGERLLMVWASSESPPSADNSDPRVYLHPHPDWSDTDFAAGLRATTTGTGANTFHQRPTVVAVLYAPGGYPVTRGGVWTADTLYLQYDAIVAEGHYWGTDDENTSGSSLPDFAGNIGGSVTDGDVEWNDLGAADPTTSTTVYALVGTPA